MTPIDNVYTKEEVNMLVQAAVAEAKEMDRELMANIKGKIHPGALKYYAEAGFNITNNQK